MELGQLLETVKSTIAALSVPSQTVAANAMLVEFERSREAWTILDSLLQEPAGSSHRLFAAISLYSKVQRDLTSQLDESSINMLTQSFVLHLLRLSQETRLELNLCRYICLSISATAVQLNKDGIVLQILSWLNPILATAPVVILELLTVLPEECFNKNIIVAMDVRLQFAQQLSNSVKHVFEFLRFVHSSATRDSKTGCQVLKCLDSWVDKTDVLPDDLSGHPIFSYLLEALAAPELFEQAVETSISVVRKFRCTDTAILAALFPRVLATKAVWDHYKGLIAAASDPEDMEEERNICRAVCRLATETAESCMPVVVGDTDNGQMSLIAMLLDCVSFSFDFNIARIPLRFFYNLSALMMKSKTGSPGRQEPGEEDYEDEDLTISHAAATRLEQVFSSLLEVSISQLVLPAPIIAGTQAISDTLIDKREEIKETVGDCVDILDSLGALQIVCTLLQKEVTVAAGAAGATVRWQVIEALLLSAMVIAPFIGSDVASSEMFGQIIAFVGSLPDIPGLKLTVINLVGRSSRWLKSHQESIGSLFPQLLSSITDPLCGEAAAIAIMSICKSCSKAPELPTQELFTVMMTLRNSQRLPLGNDLYLIEALCAVVSQAPKEALHGCLGQIVVPIAEHLGASLSSPTADAVAVGADVDRLTCALRFVDAPGSIIVDYFSRLQPMLETVLQKYPTENICEKVCRCYKHVTRNCGIAFAPLLKTMLTHLAERFRVIPVSAFIYAVANCVGLFGDKDNGAYVAMLYEAVWSVTTSLFHMLNSLELFEKKPDLIEEYYCLLTKVIMSCPTPFLESPDTSSLIEAGILALQIKQREAQKCVMYFFEKFVDMPRSFVFRPLGPPSNIELSRNLIIRYSPAIVVSLFQHLSGQITSYALNENNGCVCDVLFGIYSLSAPSFEGWATAAVAQLPESAQTIARQLNLLGSLHPRMGKMDFCSKLDEFARLCRPRT